MEFSNDGKVYTARQIHDAYDQQQNDRRSEHMLQQQQLNKVQQQQQSRLQPPYASGYNMVDSDGLPQQSTMQASYEPADQKLQHQQQHEQLQADRRYRMQPHVEGYGVRSNLENISQNNGGSAGGDAATGGSDARDNLSLPRYLEREKREKEEERDANCPPGHYTDMERQAALQSAESKFKGLINELNHMPMGQETMRVRERKAEIEKELKLLETDIRDFSKTTFYVKKKEDS